MQRSLFALPLLLFLLIPAAHSEQSSSTCGPLGAVLQCGASAVSNSMTSPSNKNWVLNPKGDWEWTQVGYGSDDAWVKDMLAKLDAVKTGG